MAAQTLAGLSSGSTADPQAYDTYLRGKQLLDSRRTADLVEAGRQFGAALGLDPNFARAWAALAESQEILAGRSGYPFIESMTTARKSVLRALELQPNLPEAHLELGIIRQRYEWDWKGAEESFQRGLAGSPSSAEGHRLYAGFLSNLGKASEAFAQIDLAGSLDPLSLRVRHLRAVILLRARQYPQAVSALEELLTEFPDFQNLYAYTGDAYVYAGQPLKAVSLHREAVRRFGSDSQFLYNLAYSLAVTGATDEARQLVGELERRWPNEMYPATYVAKVWTALGDSGRVFFWLEKAWTERDSTLMVLGVEPWYDRYRSDPRFQDLLKRIGLPVSGS